MTGPGARFQKPIRQSLLLLVDLQWARKFMDSLIRLF